MKKLNLLSLSLLCFVTLASCTETTATTPSDTSSQVTDTDTTTTDTKDPSSEKEALYNFFKTVRETKSVKLTYGEDYATDVYNANYIAYGSDSYGVVIADSYDATETSADKIGYFFTFDESENITLQYAYYNSGFLTASDLAESNYAFKLSQKLPQTRFVYDDDDGYYHTTYVDAVKYLAALLGYGSYYSYITAGDITWSYDAASQEVLADLSFTYKATSSTTKTIECDPAYFTEAGTASLGETADEVLLDSDALLGTALAESAMNAVTSYPTTFTTDLSKLGYDLSIDMMYGTSGDYNTLAIKQASGSDDSYTYFKGNNSSLYSVYLDAQNKLHETKLSSSSGSYTWSSVGAPDVYMNEKAFRLQSDGTYKYIGAQDMAEMAYYGVSFLQADDFGGSFNSLTATVTNGKVSAFNLTIVGTNSSGQTVGAVITTTVKSGENADSALPTVQTLDSDVENGIAKGLAKLTGNTTFKAESSLSNMTYTDAEGATLESHTFPGVSSLYYYDSADKVLYYQRTQGETTTGRGWKEVTTTTDTTSTTAVTPFKLTTDNKMQASNVNVDAEISDYLFSLSPALLKSKTDGTNQYVLKTTKASYITSALLLGPCGYSGIDLNSLVFTTDSEGTITSYTYNFSFEYSDDEYVSGTETVTLSYGDAATNPTSADFSSDVEAFVQPTTWKEEDSDIYADIQSALGDYADQLPYLFSSTYHGNWQSEYSSEYDQTVIVAAVSSSSAASTYLNSYYKTLTDAGLTYVGKQSGMYYFYKYATDVDGNKTTTIEWMVALMISNGYFYMLIAANN